MSQKLVKTAFAEHHQEHFPQRVHVLEDFTVLTEKGTLKGSICATDSNNDWYMQAGEEWVLVEDGDPSEHEGFLPFETDLDPEEQTEQLIDEEVPFFKSEPVSEGLSDAKVQAEVAAAGDDQKQTNPKQMHGMKKPPMSVFPLPVLFEVAVGLAEGAFKYERHNYRITGILASVYFDATMRHLGHWWEGEDTDPDSGISHISKAIASLVVLRDAMIQGKFRDDRPPQRNPDWMEDIQTAWTELCERYPEESRREPWTQERFDRELES